MADACSFSFSEQERDSNESFRLSSSRGFSSSSSDSAEDNSRTGCGKPATLSRKRAWNQSSDGAKGRMKTQRGNSFIQQICTIASNHGNQFFCGKSKTINNLIYSCAGGPYLCVWRLLLMGSWLEVYKRYISETLGFVVWEKKWRDCLLVIACKKSLLLK